MSTPPREVPGPGFIAGTSLRTWVDQTSAGSTPWLLITHPSPWRLTETAESIRDGLRDLAWSLGMQPASEIPPDLGARVLIRGPMVVLDYGHSDYAIRVPEVPAAWRDHILAGGQACVALGLDPVPPGAGQDAIDTYLIQVGLRRRLLMGAASARNYPSGRDYSAGGAVLETNEPSPGSV